MHSRLISAMRQLKGEKMDGGFPFIFSLSPPAPVSCTSLSPPYHRHPPPLISLKTGSIPPQTSRLSRPFPSHHRPPTTTRTGTRPSREAHSPSSLQQRLLAATSSDTVIVIDGSDGAELARAAGAPAAAATASLNGADGVPVNPEGHFFGTVAQNVHVAAGGNAKAALRATYALASAWGVWLGLDGDVVPSHLRGSMTGKGGGARSTLNKAWCRPPSPPLPFLHVSTRRSIA